MLRTALIFLAVTLTIFLWAENEIAPAFQSCISQHATRNSPNAPKNKGQIVVITVEDQAVCSLDLIDRHNGFFALLAAIAIAWFTYSLRNVSAEQGRLAREEFTASQRPELVMREVNLLAEPSGNVIRYTLINRGTSSCRIVESIMCVRNGDAPEELVTGGVNRIGMIQFPVGHIERLSATLSEAEQFAAGFVAEQVAAVEAMFREPIWFRGVIVYEDGNGVRRRMVFARLCDTGGTVFRNSRNPEDEYTD